MHISYEQLNAENTYRFNRLRSEYQKANRRGATAGISHPVLAMTAIVVASLVTSLAPVDSTPAHPRDKSWIEENWRALEPSWEPNLRLLKLTLNSYEDDDQRTFEPETSKSGPH